MHPIIQKLDDVFFVSKILTSRKMAAMLALGFSAGLPIMLVYTTLSAWLREVGVSRSAIGFFIWVGFAYSLKFLWAPLTDRVRIPILAGLTLDRRYIELENGLLDGGAHRAYRVYDAVLGDDTPRTFAA